jgi:Brp/Blh family beta-carotene 15,15'-monooxygenase
MQQTKIFNQITWTNALIGLLFLGWQMIAGEIPMGWQIGYFIIMIGATGIPHGALDHIVARTSAEKAQKTFDIPGFLLKYVTAIAVYSFFWMQFPGISLVLFLLISAWHFGETDLSAAANTMPWKFSRLLWGTFVLLMILLTHQTQTAQLVMRITNQSETAKSLLNFFATNGYYIIALILALCIGSIYVANRKHPWKINFFHLINLSIIMALCAALPLLPAFALYFGGWHAIRSFEIIFNFLHAERNEAAKTPISMWTNALPMTFLAAIGFVFMAFIWKGTGLQTDPLPFVFIFLSVITLPHLDVMDDLISKGGGIKKKLKQTI